MPECRVLVQVVVLAPGKTALLLKYHEWQEGSRQTGQGSSKYIGQYQLDLIHTNSTYGDTT